MKDIGGIITDGGIEPAEPEDEQGLTQYKDKPQNYMKVTKEHINKRVFIDFRDERITPALGISEVFIIEISPSGDYFKCKPSDKGDWCVWLKSEDYPILEVLPERVWKIGIA